VGKSLFYLAFCQDIPVNFIFTVIFKVDTKKSSFWAKAVIFKVLQRLSWLPLLIK